MSADTLRRWDRAGKLRTVRDARQPPPGAARRRSSGSAAGPAATRPATRCRRATASPGVVRSVEVDGVMALVEIEAGPHLDHRGGHPGLRRGARPGARRAGHGGGEGDVGDGGARMRLLRRLLFAVAIARPGGLRRRRRRSGAQATPHGVGRGVAQGARSRTRQYFDAATARSASPAPTSWPPRSARA